MDRQRLPKAFLDLLEPEFVQQLEARPDAACGLWPDLAIAYVNPAWGRFARDNGASKHFTGRWVEGSAFLDGVGKPLREYYRSHLVGALETAQPWISEYECSSATHFRLYRMEVAPVGGGQGLLVMHTRLRQEPHQPGLARETVDAQPWLDPHGHIPQCMHCRRVRRAGPTESWDWVPQWVERVPENATGSLCTNCLATRYPDLSAETS
ncbi:MAG: hypothetical protein ACKO32_05045 [Planctomycetia bacterium]